MATQTRRAGYLFAAVAFLLQALHATLIPRLSFEQLTDTSELIVSGRISDSWAAWDPQHKYIWTHYRLSVASIVKGNAASVVEFAEPGGAIDGTTMTIAGSVRYSVGDNMVVFLSRMPNGYLRTTGWAQGKYRLDSDGRLHANSTLGADIVSTTNTPPASSLGTLEGISLADLAGRISARLHATPGRAQ